MFQQGSNSDVRKGDGAEWKGSKSFNFSGTTPPGDLNDVEVEPTEFVDNSI